ncbi:hypothetical protein [Amycolatopsis minnesotensis]|uniref:hypothetical protein n=1 Tax=Amycolatopsis minnesotensis TaxID=337894 RepID=UPI0031D732D9
MTTKVRAAVPAMVLGALLALCSATVCAAPAAAAPPPVAAAVAAPPPATPSTAPPAAPQGPKIDPAQNSQANADKTKNKVIIGVIAAVLLVIVVWGRRIRSRAEKNG